MQENAKAVYLEKPRTIPIEGCDRLLAKARETGSRLFVGHNMRYMTIFRKMRELIQGGAIGEVAYFGLLNLVAYRGLRPDTDLIRKVLGDTA